MSPEETAVPSPRRMVSATPPTEKPTTGVRAGGGLQADRGEVVLAAAQDQGVGGGIEDRHVLPPGDMAQHGEIVGPAGAATTSGEKPEGKAPAGPGQLQEEIKPLFPGKGGSGKEGRLFLPGNGQRPVQIGRLLPPGAKDGGVDAVGNDGDGDSGQGGGGSGAPGNPAGAAHHSQPVPPFINPRRRRQAAAVRFPRRQVVSGVVRTQTPQCSSSRCRGPAWLQPPV